MSFLTAALIVGGATVAGTVAASAIQANAANKAAKTQAQAAQQGQDTLWDMYTQTREDLGPYRQAGYGALTRLQDLTNTPLTYPTWDPSGYAFTAPTAETLKLDPGYQFRVSEGLKALNRGGAAAGMTLSGAQSKALSRFGQDYGSQEYQAAYNRALGENALQYGRGLEAYQTNYNTLTGLRGLQYGELGGLLQSGQNAAGMQAQLGMNTANNVAQLQGQYGNALAAGIMGQGNAYSQMALAPAQAGQQYLNYQLLSNLWKTQGGAGVLGGKYGM